MNKFLKRTLETCNNEQENVPSTSNVLKKQKIVKYNTRKITFSIDFLGVVTKMLQNHSALLVGSNLQKTVRKYYCKWDFNLFNNQPVAYTGFKFAAVLHCRTSFEPHYYHNTMFNCRWKLVERWRVDQQTVRPMRSYCLRLILTSGRQHDRD